MRTADRVLHYARSHEICTLSMGSMAPAKQQQQSGGVSAGSAVLRAQVLQELMTHHAAAAGRDAARLSQEVLPALLERCGDGNTRNKACAADTVAHLAKIPEAGLASLTHIFVRCLPACCATT